MYKGEAGSSLDEYCVDFLFISKKQMEIMVAQKILELVDKDEVYERGVQEVIGWVKKKFKDEGCYATLFIDKNCHNCVYKGNLSELEGWE